MVFDDMIADMESDKKSKAYGHWFVFKRKKLNISIAFISQSYFKVPKTIKLNATHFFIMKIVNKKELQQIASNHSTDIDFKDIIRVTLY